MIRQKETNKRRKRFRRGLFHRNQRWRALVSRKELQQCQMLKEFNELNTEMGLLHSATGLLLAVFSSFTKGECCLLIISTRKSHWSTYSNRNLSFSWLQHPTTEISVSSFSDDTITYLSSCLARNQGVRLDMTLFFTPDSQLITKSCWCYLLNISSVLPLLCSHWHHYNAVIESLGWALIIASWLFFPICLLFSNLCSTCSQSDSFKRKSD